MGRYFFDSSALVKHYIEEQGSIWVGIILADLQNLIYLSTLTKLEITAALVRRVQGSPAIQQDVDARLSRFEKDFAIRFISVDLDRSILSMATDAARRLRLRAADAIQFATAMTVSAQVPASEGPLVFVTSDLELIAACKTSGIATVDPSQILPSTP